MLQANFRCSVALRVPARTQDRIFKIRNLLGRAMVQVREQIQRSPSRSPCKRRSDESSESQTIQEILLNLKKGYLMVKHSEKITSPHDKFVYLSHDNRFICWKSLDKEDEKKIEINAIDKVVKEGAEFYIRSTKIKDINRCLVIISHERKLQLQATSEVEADYFRYELNRVIKYWKGMRLNYKYNKD